METEQCVVDIGTNFLAVGYNPWKSISLAVVDKTNKQFYFLPGQFLAGWKTIFVSSIESYMLKTDCWILTFYDTADDNIIS